MGRPTKLTSPVADEICRTIRDGNFRDIAALRAGVTPRTLIAWTTRGKRERTGVFADFLHAVLAAEAEAEMTCVGRIVEASTTDPKFARWWLERKIPERWSSSRHDLTLLRKKLNDLVELWKTHPVGGSSAHSGRR